MNKVTSVAGGAEPRLASDVLTLTSHRTLPSVERIDQMHPDGADSTYTNGFSNCGPTSMSMVARAFGRGGDRNDAKLINYMAELGGTTKAGSSPDSIVKMARGLGLNAFVQGPGPDLRWIDAQLGAGRLVVAHGNYFGLPPHNKEPRTWAGGHFLVVAGKTAGGDYILRDPLDSKIDRVSGDDLARFISSHASRGHQIVISETPLP